MDSDGDILWQQVYGGISTESAPRLVDFSDSSILVVTLSMSGISGNKTVTGSGGTDIWLVEVSKSTGAIIQQNIVEHGQCLGLGHVEKNPFNNHVYMSTAAMTGIHGDKSEVGYGAYDAWLIEVDEELNVVREKVLGGSGIEMAISHIVFTEDHIFVGCGSRSDISGNKTAPNYGPQSAPTYHDAWVLKLNNDFSIVWDKSYGGNRNDYLSSISLLPTGDLAIVSSAASQSNTGNFQVSYFGTSTSDIVLSITDADGNILSQKVYGGSQDETGYLIEGHDGAYVLCATSDSGISGNKTVAGWGATDAWIAKLNISDVLSVLTANVGGFSVFPNPANNRLQLQFAQPVHNFQVTDMNGKVILMGNFSSDALHQQIDISNLLPGMYLVVINGEQLKFVKS